MYGEVGEETDGLQTYGAYEDNRRASFNSNRHSYTNAAKHLQSVSSVWTCSKGVGHIALGRGYTTWPLLWNLWPWLRLKPSQGAACCPNSFAR